MKAFKNQLIFGFIFFLLGFVFVFYIGNNIVPRVMVNFSKASSSDKVSIKNSFLLGEKILSRADGIDKCIVNVFVLDNSGKGVSNSQVVLSGLGVLNGVTNDIGRVSFELSSFEANQYNLTASVNGLPLGKSLAVTFR